MSTGLEDQLRKAFEQASEFVQPRPGLERRIRLAARRRRDVLLATSTACAIIVASAGGYLAASHRNQPPPSASKRDAARLIMRTRPGTLISQLAVAGRYLYVLTELPTGLEVYNRITGRLIRKVAFGGYPTTLTIGPTSSIWVTFIRPGLWLLSPDLRKHSIDLAGSYPVVPTGPTTALTVTPRGVVSITVPAPGQPGRTASRLLPGTRSLGKAYEFTWAGLLGGRLAVQETTSRGRSSRLVIAGRPGIGFGGSPQREVETATTIGSSLWATTYDSRIDTTAPFWGRLVQLDRNLQVITPTTIEANPLLRKVEIVWSVGNTVWVTTARSRLALACFTDDGQPGPVVAMRVTGRVVFLAESGTTIYVTTEQLNGNGRWAVTSYPVPAACR
jgi:hypothetical protein